jgi:hypothetical protein
VVWRMQGRVSDDRRPRIGVECDVLHEKASFYRGADIARLLQWGRQRCVWIPFLRVRDENVADARANDVLAGVWRTGTAVSPWRSRDADAPRRRGASPSDTIVQRGRQGNGNVAGENPAPTRSRSALCGPPPAILACHGIVTIKCDVAFAGACLATHLGRLLLDEFSPRCPRLSPQSFGRAAPAMP